MSCGAIDPTDNSYEMRQVIIATYIYYISKMIDLLDTVRHGPDGKPENRFTKTLPNVLQVFFVLRKKNSQISFLHVYHHAGMIFGTYIHTKFLSGGVLYTNYVYNNYYIKVFCIHACFGVVFRESRNFARCNKFLRPRCNVQLLFIYIISARIEEFIVVEKAYHANPTREYSKFEN